MRKHFLKLLAVMLVVACLGGVLGLQSLAADTVTAEIEVTYDQDMARAVLSYVNDFRADSNAWYYNASGTKVTVGSQSALVWDYDLEKIAMQRAAEIVLAFDYGHLRPDGSSYATAFTGYSYTMIGENIANGMVTYYIGSASDLFNQWLEEDEDYSGQGHRRNMLGLDDSGNALGYNKVAVACVEYGGMYFCVMELAQSSSTSSATAAVNGTATVSVDVASSTITSLTLSSLSAVSLNEGETAVLPTVGASLRLSNTSSILTGSLAVTFPSLSWSSNDTSVATIQNGMIVGVGPGNATISATVDGQTVSFTVEVASAHVISRTIEAKDPTCTEAGNYEYYYCEHCNKYFSDPELTLETTPADMEIPATGHDWDEGVVTKGATCTETGVRTYTCQVCGETKTEDIPMVDHDYVKAVTAPTCTSQGYTTYACSMCGTSYTTDYMDPIGHDWDDGAVTQAPTCTENGTIVYTCENCGATKTDEIPPLGHDYEVTSTVAPTCTDKGYTVYTCAQGDSTYTVEAPATGHSWGSGVVTEEATETENGKIEYTCTACGVTKTDEIPATGEHSWVVSDTEEATCTSMGSVTYTCEDEDCGLTYTVTVDALGHDYVLTASTAATCTEKGFETYTCSCGDTYTVEIPATGHSYDGGTVTGEPTCTDTGTMTYTCTVCGHTYSVTLDTIDHSWDEGEVIQPATCVETGLIRYTCEVCGETYVADIPLAEHTYGAGVITTEPTCTESGVMTYTCTECGATYTEVIDALGHDFAGTCTCVRCGAYDPTYVAVALSGDGAVYDLGAGGTLTFISSDSIGCFQSVLVDGQSISSDNYTITEGSIQVTLSQAYLRTLTNGDHTLTIVSNHGPVEFSFSVTGSLPEDSTGNNDGIDGTTPGGSGDDMTPGGSGDDMTSGGSGTSSSEMSPQTGDNSQVALFAALLVLCTGGIVAIVVVRKKKDIQ